jgi:hypothetical protein
VRALREKSAQAQTAEEMLKVIEEFRMLQHKPFV